VKAAELAELAELADLDRVDTQISESASQQVSESASSLANPSRREYIGRFWCDLGRDNSLEDGRIRLKRAVLAPITGMNVTAFSLLHSVTH
jgi:hypothetical protein